MFVNGINNPIPIKWECKACGGHTRCVLEVYNGEPLFPICPLDINEADFKCVERDQK
jgi:hypothetical protein